MRSQQLKTLAKHLFILTFCLTLFLELFFGLPSALFLLMPQIYWKGFPNSLNELLLLNILLFSLIGVLVLVFKLLMVERIQFQKMNTDERLFNFTKLISYDFFTAISILVMSSLYIGFSSNLWMLMQPTGQRIFTQAMNDYEWWSCDQRSPSSSSSMSSQAIIDFNNYVDKVQYTNQCCGWNSAQDWIGKEKGQLPWSCCPFNRQCASNCDPMRSDRFQIGCQSFVPRLLDTYNLVSYGFGMVYYLLKVMAYFLYCYAYKEAVDHGNFLLSYRQG